MSKRKLEEYSLLKYSTHRIYSKNREIIYVLSCNNIEEAQWLKNECIQYIKEIKISLQEHSIVLGPIPNESLNSEISQLVNNGTAAVITTEEIMQLVDLHLESNEWRMKTGQAEQQTNQLPPMIANQIKSLWDNLIRKKTEFNKIRKDDLRYQMIGEMISILLSVKKKLSNLSNLYPPYFDLYKKTPLKLLNKTEKEVQIKKKLDSLANLIEKRQHDIVFGNLIVDLTNNMNEIHSEYYLIKTKYSTYPFFKHTQLATETIASKSPTQNQYNCIGVYHDDLVDTLLKQITRNLQNLYICKVMMPFEKSQTAFYKQELQNAIFRAQLTKMVTLMPLRILEIARNYLISVVVKHDQEGIVIKLIDSYGSLLELQTTYTPQGNIVECKSLEQDFIITDINELDESPCLHLPFMLSPVLCQFIDNFLVPDKKLFTSTTSQEKIKFVATGIVQQPNNARDSGPYIIYNFVQELCNKPLEKVSEENLRKIQEKYLPQAIKLTY